MNALRQRIERLSKKRRILLSHWLGSGSANLDHPTSAVGRPKRQWEQMVAYVVAAADADTDNRGQPALQPAQLREYLRGKLPNFMVPDLLVQVEGLPRLPNGKVDLRALRHTRTVESEAEDTDYVAPRNDIERTLSDIWSDLIGVDKIGVHDNFFEIGGDSIVSIQVISRARAAGIHVEPKYLLDHPTIAELASTVDLTGSDPADQELIVGRTPLTPIQQWFFGLKLKAPHHWNQAALFELSSHLRPDVLKRALQHCIRHHDVLRSQFKMKDSDLRQSIADVDAVTAYFSKVDLSSLSAPEREVIRQRHIAKSQASLDLSKAPLIRAVLFEQGENQPRVLLMVIHHLVVDIVSWSVLLTDLEDACRQLQAGDTAMLPPKTTSYRRWAERLVEYAQSSQLQDELEFWLTSPMPASNEVPVDFAHEGFVDEESTRTIKVSLDTKQTAALLNKVQAAYNTNVQEILLTAVIQTFRRWSGSCGLRIALEGHGRNFHGIDASRTVGWFTSFFPVNLQLEYPHDSRAAIMSVKEQLRAIPNGGLGYGVLRYLSDDRAVAERLSQLPSPNILFNYLGQAEKYQETRMFRRLPGAEATSRDPRNRKHHLLEINAAIVEGRLTVDWLYSKAIHRHTTIEAVARDFIAALVVLIDHCISGEAGGFTPSDFPEADLSQEELDRFLETYE